MKSFRLGRLEAAPTLGLLSLTVVASVGCTRVFVGRSYLPMLIAVAVTVHLTMALARLLRIHGLLTVPLAFLAMAAVVGRRMYPTSMIAGFIPSKLTFTLAAHDIRESVQQFSSVIAPVPATGGFLLAAAVGVGLVSFAADTLAFRAYGRTEAVIPAGVYFTFVAVLGEAGHHTTRLVLGAAFFFTAVVCVALLRNTHAQQTGAWLADRPLVRTVRTAIGAVIVAALTTGVAYAAAPHLPGAKATGLINPRADENRPDNNVNVVSPIVDIRNRLTGNRDAVMFEVVAASPRYWRLTSLPDFDGRLWQSSEKYADATGPLRRSTPQGRSLRQTFTIATMGSGWVPAAYQPVAISGSASFVFNAESATVRLSGNTSLSAGMTYIVNSVVPTPNTARLRRATSSKPPSARYLRLPERFPTSLVDVAQSIVEGVTNPYDKAKALQDWFRNNFTYDLDVPAGNGTNAIESFLERRRGYCEQFAGTFAAFARVVGLPSRVAIGFTQGVLENDRYVVRSRNAHAWPEVWFDGIGWLAFEPTPGRGAPGDQGYTGVEPAQDTATGDSATGVGATTTTVPDTSATPTTGPTPGTETATGAGTPTSVVSETTVAPTTPGGGSSIGWILLALLMAASVLALWFVALPRWIRTRRDARDHTSADRVLTRWREATAILVLFGTSRRADETPIEHADRVATVPGLVAEDIDFLAHAATEAMYAADGVDDADAEECSRIVQRLVVLAARRAPWKYRWRIALDPRLLASRR